MLPSCTLTLLPWVQLQEQQTACPEAGGSPPALLHHSHGHSKRSRTTEGMMLLSWGFSSAPSRYWAPMVHGTRIAWQGLPRAPEHSGDCTALQVTLVSPAHKPPQ